MKTSRPGQNLIKRDEALRLKAYFCIAGRPTISYGVTDGVTADDVRNGRTITIEQAEQMFTESLGRFERCVSANCTVPPNQNQFDAMVSLAYNIGEGGFSKSSVLKAHNRGDFAAAAAAFALWNKATIGGVLQVSNGLTARRAREAALYLQSNKGDDGTSVPDMPQVVAEPKAGFIAFLVGLAMKLLGGKKS